MTALRLLTNQTANGVGATPESQGRAYNLVIWGNFGATPASVTFQQSPDAGTTWITPELDSGPAVFTAAATVKVDFPGFGTLVRCLVALADGSTNLNAELF